MNHRAVVLAGAALAALSVPAWSAGAHRPLLRGGWFLARPLPAMEAAFAADTTPRDTVPRDTTPRARTRPDSAARDTARGDSTRARDLPPDTLVDRLLRLRGYTPTEYVGDSASYSSADRTLRLRGSPQVTRDGTTLTARDSLVYQEESSFAAAYGRPRVTGNQAEPLQGDTLFYDLNRGRASVRGAETTINENGTWLVKGDVTSEEQGRRIYARGSRFTSDDRPEPAYHFRAGRIMVLRNRILVGRPATLYFQNVPVMALPFIVQDLERGRRSGFLVPQFELNDIFRTHSPRGNERGTGREISNIGYYWAINPYMGASLAMGWRSSTYTQYQGNLDFNWRRRFLQGSFGGTIFDRGDEETTYTLNGRGNWQPTERTTLNGSLDYAQSSQFQRNRTVDPFRQTQDINSSFALTRKLDWGSFSSSLSRRQSLANDDVTLTPSISLNVDPITFFAPRAGEEARWYNDATLNLGGVSVGGSRFSTRDTLARRPATDQYSVTTSPSIQFGDLGISTSISYQFDRTGTLRGLDTAGTGLPPITGGILPVGGRTREVVALSAGTGYQIPLIGSTRLTPSVSLRREYVRADTAVAADTIGGPDLDPRLEPFFGRMVAGPTRLVFSATLGTDLYGFFPGVAGYSAVRHHFRPSVSYNYSPAPGGRVDSAQVRLFGPQVGQTQNTITFGMDNTFEAKVRTPRPVEGDSMADSTAAARGNAAAPQDARKVTLLAVNTSAIGYSFSGADSIPRFQTDVVTNSVRSDLLGGLQFTMAHDLFEEERTLTGRVQRGVFSPFLTQLGTSFSLGSNSALFRRLGFGGRPEQERTPAEQRGRTADSAGVRAATPPGGATATGNNQRTGGGAWNLNLDYSLSRTRRTTGDVRPGRFESGDQSLNGGLTFFPTKNWAVSWRTQYSLSAGEFSAQSIQFKRDLYRWEANFGFNRAPNGNTSFDFRVHLIDLPDLKADYNESNLGADRRETETRRPVTRTRF